MKTFEEKREEFIETFDEEPRTLLITRSELGILILLAGKRTEDGFAKEIQKLEKRGIDPTQEEAETFGMEP